MVKINKAYKTYADFRIWCFEVIGKICVKCGNKNNLEIDHIDREFDKKRIGY